MARTSWLTAGLTSRGRRLVAAAVAIVIGVAFLSASVAVLATAQAGLEDAVGAGLRDADLVVEGRSASLTVQEHDDLARLDEVASVAGETFVMGEIGPRSTVVGAPLPATGTTLTSGRLPYAPGEVLANADLVDVGVAEGEQLVLTPYTGEEASAPVSLQVVGVADFGTTTMLGYGPGFAAPDQTLRLVEPGLTYQNVRVELTDGADAAEVRARITQTIPEAGVLTGPEAAQERVNAVTGQTAVLAAIALGFGAVALATAAIVIANTFTITLAQRTTELALLRCVGATRGQVRRSVLVEAAVLGVVASAAGVLAGLGVAWGLLRLGRRLDLPIPLGAGVEIGPVAVLLPLLVGVLVTVIASLWPTVRATRVSPLAALRPTGVSSEVRRVGWLRLGLAVLLLGAGVAAMVYAAANRDIVAGLAGGLVSFAGVLVAAVVVVPAAVRVLGLLARPAGAPGQLAVDNAVRNPGRAAATSAALLVGVTLITMTSVGAASAERSALGEIDRTYAVDLVATTADDGDGTGTNPVSAPLPPGVLTELSAAEGVRSATPAQTAYLTVNESSGKNLAIGLDQDQAREAIRSADLVAALRPGTLGLGSTDLAVHGLDPGERVTVTGPGGARELTVTELGLGHGYLTLHVDDLTALAADQAAEGAVLLRLDEGGDVGAAMTGVSRIADDATMDVVGAAAERAVVTQVLDVLVLVTTALLGVAVVIAVVGIANTLSLSVVERHREHALLRGLGLTRPQMRTMLLTEGVLLAAVSAVLGLLLGVGYAALGVMTLLPEGTPLALALPWLRVTAILGVALLAGVLASVLPARRAVRVSPAQGLAAA